MSKTKNLKRPKSNFFVEILAAFFNSFTKSFHQTAMATILDGLDANQQRIVRGEATTNRLKILIQLHVVLGFFIDIIFELPGNFRMKPAPIDPSEENILRNASLSDNLMARTLTVKCELFIEPGINFQFRSPQHYRYHSTAIRSAVKMVFDDIVLIPQAIIIVIIDSVFYCARWLSSKLK